MIKSCKKRKEENGIAVAIDADNLLISAAVTSSGKSGRRFKGHNLMAGFEKMFEWLETFGKIMCVHVYLSPIAESINDVFLDMLWERYKDKFLLLYVHCPKKGEQDNVDNYLIYHTGNIVANLKESIKYLVLASGDLDYSPLLWPLKRNAGLEVGFVIGNEISFSREYRKTDLIAKHPVTQERLIHYFSPRQQ